MVHVAIAFGILWILNVFILRRCASRFISFLDPSSTWVHYTGEPIGPVGSNRSDGHRVKLFEESVTFIAQLHPEVRLL